jgi:HK97 gp10 family phage protein
MATESFEIKVTNDHTKEIIAECHRKCLAALELCGQRMERNAKINIENNPRRVDTGLLRNSITHAMAGGYPAQTTYQGSNASRYNPNGEIPTGAYFGQAPTMQSDAGYSDQAVYVGTNVEYGIYVHEGTQRMAPNRFIRNAMSEHIDEYKTIIEKVLKS